MAKGARKIPVQANLRRDSSDCIGVTLRAVHARTSVGLSVLLVRGRQLMVTTNNSASVCQGSILEMNNLW